VAHVGTVRQVVVAEHAGKQRIGVGRFERRAARGVEDDGFRIDRAQAFEFGADGGEGALPVGLDIMIGRRIVAHRMGQPALGLQIEIAPAKQFGDRVAGEEFRRRALVGQFPQCRLGAVLAKLGDMGFGGLGPGAGDAGKTVRFVLLRQNCRAVDHSAVALQMAQKRFHRAPAAGGLVVGLDLYPVPVPIGSPVGHDAVARPCPAARFVRA
jgi:hypothetical protein